MKNKGKYVLMVVIIINIIGTLLFLHNKIVKTDIYLDQLKVIGFESELTVEDDGINKNILNLKNGNENTDSDKLINTTRVYFSAEITKGYSNGDCILLENYDSEGNKTYGLIDTGRQILKKDSEGNNSTVVKEFLKKHGVTNLEFLAITHSHGDHNGDVLTVLDNFEVDKIYIKEYDQKWVAASSANTNQKTYENLIKKAIDKDIKVIGVSYPSLTSSEISPSRSQEFVDYIKNAKEELFESFDEQNTKFEFGSSNIQIFNWEIFDIYGKQYITGISNDVEKETVSNENNNSIGLLLSQGNKKAFFSGDMNNLDKNEAKGRVGDEDRLKDQIGKVDLLKLGHHGYMYSNTEDYINVLKPEYAVITNDMGGAYKDTINWLEGNNVNYLYTTSDEYGISATIMNDDIYLGFETEESFKNIKNTIYYVPKEAKYVDYTKVLYELEYQEKNVDVSSWEELKEVIDNNKNKIVKIDDDSQKCILNKLIVNLKNGGNWTADETIEVGQTQQVILTTSEDIKILRGTDFKDNSLFLLNGLLSLGTDKMTGKITIDGNNIQALSTLIKLDSGILDVYDNVTLCNNVNKITKENYTGSNYTIRGSAIYSNNAIINMYGGSIKDNKQDIVYDYILPKEMTSNQSLDTYGTGIFMTNYSIFNMFGGEISNNEAQNHSAVYTNDSYTNAQLEANVYQKCSGVGIYAVTNSEVNLLGGKISENIAENYAKTTVTTASDNTKNTNINSLSNAIYGVGIYVVESKIKISNDFVMSSNTAKQNSDITIEKDASIKNSVLSSTRGIQAYISNSEVTIEGVEITDGSYQDNLKIVCEGSIGTSGSELVNKKSLGGGLYINNSKINSMNGLNIHNCMSDYGGGIYFSSINAIISNSNISENKAKYGGGIYSTGSSSNIEFKDVSITKNIATDGSGGGIYAYGNLDISGNKTDISNNEAATYGGGLMIKTTATINDGKICDNIANKNAGGGIRVDGELTLNGGIITGNSANTTGGGIDYTNGSFYCNSGIIQNNMSIKEGNNVYPIGEVSSIEIKTRPVKMKYIQNHDELDLTGGVIIVKYNNGTSHEENMTNEVIKATGFSNTKLGINTITLEYEGKIITFDVEIVENLKENYMLGDINKDNKITITDLILLKRHLIAGTMERWRLSDEQQGQADINEDGKISITDLVLLKRIILENN